MFHTIADFETTWAYESEQMLLVLSMLTDATLGQAVRPGERTLGRLGWHLATTIPEMMSRTGLEIAEPNPHAPVPPSAAAIRVGYAAASAALLGEIHARWTDGSLKVEDEMYGEKWTRGMSLGTLVLHQVHHRGQMTVLMRQAGLRVPGIYGPAKEDWAKMNMSPPAV
jgi:uncharacterized damage-inducible protein DinB